MLLRSRPQQGWRLGFLENWRSRFVREVGGQREEEELGLETSGRISSLMVSNSQGTGTKVDCQRREVHLLGHALQSWSEI
jgi:hypothetical protein